MMLYYMRDINSTCREGYLITVLCYYFKTKVFQSKRLLVYYVRLCVLLLMYIYTDFIFVIGCCVCLCGRCSTQIYKMRFNLKWIKTDLISLDFLILMKLHVFSVYLCVLANIRLTVKQGWQQPKK